MQHFEMINVSGRSQNQSVHDIRKDLRTALTQLWTQKNHYAIVSKKTLLFIT